MPLTTITTMSSGLSHAAAPCMKADASAVVPAYHDTQLADTSSTRQDPTPRPSVPRSQDDIIIKPLTTFLAVLRRRNSTPIPISAIVAASTAVKREQELTAAFDLFRVEHGLMSIELSDDGPGVPAIASVSSTSAEQQPGEPTKRDLLCIICATVLPDETEPDFAEKVIEPCWKCDSSFCVSCITYMFVKACNDITRMPPRCCIPINLSHARPHLSQDEIQLFKTKYEEWLTPNPFYCPVPTCSAFIPERLLPGRARMNGKRVDSGTATPTSKTFTCPTCEASICLDCRQLAHPCSPCNVSESGLDEETARLLKSWGYKQCPKCRHGLKRMFGCNHMECRCGAHFCYICMGDPNDCGPLCWEREGEGDEDDDDESLSSPDDANAPENHAQAECQGNEAHNAPPAQSRNLDGRGGGYWMHQPLNFGDEPGEEAADPFWNCNHSLAAYKVNLGIALSKDPSELAVECVRCWGTAYPAIRPPNGDRRAAVTHVAGRHHEHDRRQRYFVPVRSVSYCDDTTGPTRRRNSIPSSFLSQSVSSPWSSPTHDNNSSSSKQVFDLYGNLVFPAEPAHNRRRRLSLHDDSQHHRTATADATPTSSLLTVSSPSLGISLAHECQWCDLLVCNSCKEDLNAAQEEKGKAKAKAAAEPAA